MLALLNLETIQEYVPYYSPCFKHYREKIRISIRADSTMFCSCMDFKLLKWVMAPLGPQ